MVDATTITEVAAVLAATFGLILLLYTFIAINPSLGTLSATTKNLSISLDDIKANLTNINNNLENLIVMVQSRIQKKMNTLEWEIGALNKTLVGQVRRVEISTNKLNDKLIKLEDYLLRLNATLNDLIRATKIGTRNITKSIESLNATMALKFNTTYAEILQITTNMTKKLDVVYSELENAIRTGNVEVVSNVSKLIESYQADMNKTVNELKALLDKLDSQLVALNQTQADLRNAIDSLNAKLLQLNVELKQLNTLNNELKTQINDLKKTIADLKSYINTKVSEMDKKIEESKQEILNEVDMKYKQLEQKISFLTMLQVIPALTLIISVAALYLLITA